MPLRDTKTQLRFSTVLNVILIFVILMMVITFKWYVDKIKERGIEVSGVFLNNSRSVYPYHNNQSPLKSNVNTNSVEIFGIYLNASNESLCFGRGRKQQEFFKKLKNVIDPLNVGPFDFLPDYKNPCFVQNVTKKGKNGTSVQRIRCIPYFYIAGMPKSGTTDLWHALSFHPDVYVNHFKEPMWFNRKRFAGFNFESYLDFYDSPTKAVIATYSSATCHKKVPYHHLIIGEGSVDYSFDNNRWSVYPGNENCNEPIVLTPHHIHNINPAVKLIFLLRDPVDRVYSDYLYESLYVGYNKSHEDFHLNVLQNMIKHVECRKLFTQRACAYDFTTESYKARLRVGMYHIFLEDWLRVFPKQQILIIKFEDYASDTQKELLRVMHHLEVRPMAPEEIIRIKKRRIQNRRSRKDYELGDMWPSTRTILQEFYKPFNENLSKLLNDESFLWK